MCLSMTLVSRTLTSSVLAKTWRYATSRKQQSNRLHFALKWYRFKYFTFSYVFFLGVKGRNLDAEKLFAYLAVSRSFLSMWRHLVISTPGITESWQLPQSKWKFSWWWTRTVVHRINAHECYYWAILIAFYLVMYVVLPGKNEEKTAEYLQFQAWQKPESGLRVFSSESGL